MNHVVMNIRPGMNFEPHVHRHKSWSERSCGGCNEGRG